MNFSELRRLTNGRAVIYLLDATNDLEQELLRESLRKERSIDESNAQPYTVPILGSREPGRLSHALTAPEDTLIAPVRVVWQPPDAANDAPRFKDLLFGDRRRPGKYRGRYLHRKHPERAVPVVGQPATIGELRERFGSTVASAVSQEPREFAEFVERQAGLVLDIAERGLKGSRYKVPRFVAESLEACGKFNAAIDDLSGELGKPRQAVMKEARAYMREMIARPSAFWIDVLGFLNRFIRTRGYEAEIVCDEQSIARARRLVREHPSLILWTHKSHLDGFAINSVCFENDFPAPHIMGGINMAFAGFGFLGRRSAAIFIRRSFRDNPLYKLVLQRYVGYLMEKRFPLSWAFEGTRSRVGKLMPPRYGLLKYALDAARETDTRDIHILPVSITYDLITDVADYAAEQTGIRKTPESLRWFLGYLQRLRQPLGRIYVNFGEPIVLDRAPPEEDDLALSKLAFQVAVNANAATPITLPALGCLILLGSTPRALTSKELRAEFGAFIEWARNRNISLTSDFDRENAYQLRTIIDIMIKSGLVTRYAEGPQAVYGISPEQQLHASYYRNTVIHYFVNKAIAELALAKAGHADRAGNVFWREAERLRDLFKFEFFYPPLLEFKEQLKYELAEVRPDWEAVLDEGGSGVARMLAAMQPHVAHATLSHFVEAYSVAADLLAGRASDRAFEVKDCVARAMKYARQRYLQRRITSEASISEPLFRNAHKWFENQELTQPGDARLSDRRRAVAVELRDLLARIERIRALAVTAHDRLSDPGPASAVSLAQAGNQ